jgi:glycosyltransferase involved in cell wall biosynthesis
VSRLIERTAVHEARVAVRRSGRFLALSADYAAASRVVGGLAAGAVGVAPPVDPAPFHPVDPAPLRGRLGLPPGPVVGFVGRLVPEKGLPVLLEAMRLVRRTHPDARLVIAGEGRAVAGGGIADDLEAAVRGEGWVTFTGFLPQDDLPAFYAMCDVLALPSVDPLEAYGIVQVEAMLCGTPVVASDMPGVRIPVTVTGMGRLAPPGDGPTLAVRLREVLDDPAGTIVPRERLARLLSPEIPLRALASAVAEAAARTA